VVRPLLVPFLVVFGLLLIALVLPSKRDTSVAAWWMRVRRDVDMCIRAAIGLGCVAAAVWFIVLPLLGWR
jgi:hypothetical protein